MVVGVNIYINHTECSAICFDQLLCRLEFRRLVCFWRTVESDDSESERRQLMKQESVRRQQQIVYDKALNYKVGG